MSWHFEAECCMNSIPKTRERFGQTMQSNGLQRNLEIGQPQICHTSIDRHHPVRGYGVPPLLLGGVMVL